MTVLSDQLKKLRIASEGDLVIFANGDKHHQHGGTNTMVIIKI